MTSFGSQHLHFWHIPLKNPPISFYGDPFSGKYDALDKEFDSRKHGEWFIYNGRENELVSLADIKQVLGILAILVPDHAHLKGHLFWFTSLYILTFPLLSHEQTSLQVFLSQLPRVKPLRVTGKCFFLVCFNEVFTILYSRANAYILCWFDFCFSLGIFHCAPYITLIFSPTSYVVEWVGQNQQPLLCCIFFGTLLLSSQVRKFFWPLLPLIPLVT